MFASDTSKDNENDNVALAVTIGHTFVPECFWSDTNWLTDFLARAHMHEVLSRCLVLLMILQLLSLHIISPFFCWERLLYVLLYGEMRCYLRCKICKWFYPKKKTLLNELLTFCNGEIGFHEWQRCCFRRKDLGIWVRDHQIVLWLFC